MLWRVRTSQAILLLFLLPYAARSAADDSETCAMQPGGCEAGNRDHEMGSFVQVARLSSINKGGSIRKSSRDEDFPHLREPRAADGESAHAVGPTRQKAADEELRRAVGPSRHGYDPSLSGAGFLEDRADSDESEAKIQVAMVGAKAGRRHTALARVIPEAWKYERNAGTCHVLPEALDLWQCRQFCALLHNYPSDCAALTALTNNSMRCCEFVHNTQEGYKVSARITLPGSVLLQPHAKNEARKLLATVFAGRIGFPIAIAVLAQENVSCAAGGENLGTQSTLEACEEVVRASESRYFAYGKSAEEGACVAASGSEASGTGNCDFYRLAVIPEVDETETETETECNWTRHIGTYSGGYAGGESFPLAKDDAQTRCVELGSATCKAVTCNDGGACTPRAGSHLGVSPSSETTYVPSAGCFSQPVPWSEDGPVDSVLEEVFGAWVCKHYDSTKGENARWCQTIGRQDNFEYKYQPGSQRCGGCWCCMRSVSVVQATDTSRDVRLAVAIEAADNAAVLMVSVSSEKAELGMLVQSSVEHLRKYPHRFVSTLLYALGLATEDEAKDQCRHLGDPCDCAFQQGCKWSNGTCSTKPPGPECVYTSINGSLQGPMSSQRGVFPRAEAERKCTEDAACLGLSCTDGARCTLKREGTVHERIDATNGLLREIFHNLPGSDITALTDSQAFKDGSPDDLALMLPGTSEGLEWRIVQQFIGARFTGTFWPNKSGIHHFWVVCDSRAVFMINDTEVARCNSWGHMGQIRNDRHGQAMLERAKPTKVELLYWGSHAWWNNHVQLFFAEPDPTAVTDEMAPARYQLKSVNTGHCVDTFGGPRDGATLGLWQCGPGGNREFVMLAHHAQNGATVYTIKTEHNRMCFRPEGARMKVRSCDNGGVPLTWKQVQTKTYLFAGDSLLCCRRHWNECDVLAGSTDVHSCPDITLLDKADALPDLQHRLVPLSMFTPDVQPASYAKDCRRALDASCEECDRQPMCAVSDLQLELDNWCRQHTQYPLARKHLQSWRCFSDSADSGLDFTINGLCVDSCGFPMLCPGGVRGPSTQKTTELTDVIIANQDDPCADTSHVTSPIDPDELYGSLLTAELSAPTMPILAVSLQDYLDELCSSLLNKNSAARLILNTTDHKQEWACMGSVSTSGAWTGMCASNCGTAVACESTVSFGEVLDFRPFLLENAAHGALKHFCKSELSYVSEADTLVTFRLGRTDFGSLHEDPTSAQLVEEVIADVFAEKILVDPQTVRVSLRLAIGNCVRFRATQNCDPDGDLMPELDQACDEHILSTLSGYCECLHGLRTAKSNCSHGPFVCSQECDSLLGNASSERATSVPEERPRIHVRTYQAEDASLFGPQGLLARDAAIEQESQSCTWTAHPGKYSGHYASGDSTTYSLEDAKARCVELGAPLGHCKAVTCHGLGCTVRGSEQLGNYAPETTYVPSAACFQDVKPEVLGGKFHTGYTGSGFVSLQKRGESIEWKVNVETTGNYTVSVRYSYAGQQFWGSLKDMTLRVNGVKVTDRFRFTATSSWSNWQKVPIVVTLSAGSNLIVLIRGDSYYGNPGPYVDAIIVTTFAGATSWNCLAESRDIVRLNAAGEVEAMSRNARDSIRGDCAENLKNPVPPSELQPLVCGEPHSQRHGWWNWGWESMGHWCWRARRSLYASMSGSDDVDGVDVRVVLRTSNPTQAFNIMRRVQVVYGDEVLSKAIEQEVGSLPTAASFTTGDVVVTNLIAAEGTKSTEPTLAKSAVQDAYWNATGQIIHWPCGGSCEEPSGRYVEAWGVGPFPVAGGEFIYGEKHYHSTRQSEKLQWVLHRPLGEAQEWSFHMRIMLESRHNKRGSFVLWSEDGKENYIEFDVNNRVASDMLTGNSNGPQVPAVYVSGPSFWSLPNLRTSESPTDKEWHDVSIVKKDCTVSVFIDGREALANIPQYWKVSAVGFWPRNSGIRILNFGMTHKGPAVDPQGLTPFCKMYLDQTVGFRLMRKGKSGCLKVTGSHSPVLSTMDMKECTFFYFKDSSMRDISTGQCLDYYAHSKSYGLWTCHGGWNQKFGPYRTVEGKYQFMRFCLGHFDCLDELDFGICRKLNSACECSEYPKICGWDTNKGVCTSEKKDDPIPCSACDRQPKCAAEHHGALQSLADEWCRNNTDFSFARLLYRAHYLTQRWACFSQTGLPVERNGLCMDRCGYPVECGAGPMPHDLESVDVHERIINEVLFPNVIRTCDDPFRFSNLTCAELGWGPGKGREEVCASARGPLNRLPCGHSVSFSDAAQQCRDIGARLCTETELAHDEAKLAGCALEKTLLWAKHANCSAGTEHVMPGASEFTPFFEPRCMDVNEKAALVCCADTEKPYIHIHPADLAERKPHTPLTINSAVWVVRYKTATSPAIDMCLHIQGSMLVAQRCSRGQTLFVSKGGQLHPWEENSGTPMRTHLCLEASQESITAKTCTMGAGDRLRLTDSGKLFVGVPGSESSRCLSFDESGLRSMSHIQLEIDETQCGAWLFSLKHHVATPIIPPEIKTFVEAGSFDDDVAESVVRASVEQAKEAAGETVSSAFWDWVAGVPGMQLSLASTSFPIHQGTIANLYRLWLYFGADWDDTMSSLALATAYKARDRNVLENDVAFVRGFGVGIHKSCGCKSPNECGFPAHRGSLPKGGEFLEYYLGLAKSGTALELPVFEGTRGAPWPLMTDWSAVPLDECQYHNINGYSPGEYTFRYGRHEIKCKHSDWHPESGPRIAEDGGVCGRLSYLSAVSYTCGKASPSRGVGQPGHAAGFKYVKDEEANASTASYRQQLFWDIYDERVSHASWTLALTENLWGQHGRHGHEHRGRGANTQWHKTVPTSLSLSNGVRRWETSRLAAMVAIQASYWQDADSALWMQHALSYDPYNIEVWEFFRVRIEQGKTDSARALELWGQFKQSMVIDAPVSFHALAEDFFFTVVDSRSCDREMLAWQVAQVSEIFAVWREKQFNFDIVAAEAIFLLKQVECAVLLDGFQKMLDHAQYGKLMNDLLDENVGKEPLNLQGPPYGGGRKGVMKILDMYLKAEVDRSKRMEAIEWIRPSVRPGMMQWELFGKSYFYWMQYERVVDAEGSMVPWLSAKFAELGEDDMGTEFSNWVESCLTRPWNHTHISSRGIVFDGCYYGKNGDMGDVQKFMDWMIPYHASGGQNDTCFPDWALKMLRMAGHALLQKGNETGANGTSVNEAYVACLEEQKGSTRGAAGLSTECRAFIQHLAADDQSGHAEAEESEFMYKDDGFEDSEQQRDGPFLAEDFEDLPQWLQKKFEAALTKRPSAVEANSE